MALRELLSNEKSFEHRWVGSQVGNRLGLHIARVKLAEACARVRRHTLPTIDPVLESRLRRDGFVVIEDALPAELVGPARLEFEAVLAEHTKRVPMPPARTRGFGPKLPNACGFDRYDGGSLNRFVDIDERCVALRRAFADDGRIVALLRSLSGTRVGLDRFLVYQLVHGSEACNPDLQREVHCDTFHETYKAWYFFDEVGVAKGPLMYSPGSHRSPLARLRWEQRCAVEGRSLSASFRIDAAALKALGWKPPEPVLTRPNSLVLANTRGFHCRSIALAGTERPCVYANLRPRAFGLRVPPGR